MNFITDDNAAILGLNRFDANEYSKNALFSL